MGMSYHIKQQVVQDFFSQDLIFLENGKTGLYYLLKVEEAASSRLNKNVDNSMSRRCGTLSLTVTKWVVQNNLIYCR